MKFIIPKGQEFYCEFTVKEPGANVPMDLSNAVGHFTLSTLGLDPCVVLDGLPLDFPDPVNGIASIFLLPEQTENLVTKIGFAEDGYPPMPTYKASLNIVASEPVFVEIPKIYVSDRGESCGV